MVEKQIKDHDDLIYKFLKADPNLIEVHHENVLKNPEKEFKKISEFVGRKVPHHLIARKETWYGNHKIN
jgi:hypothetical protein